MLSNPAVQVTAEAYYRLGALHHAGIMDYDKSTRLFDKHLRHLNDANNRLGSAYDLTPWNQTRRIKDVVTAYHRTINQYFRGVGGLQLELFRDVSDIEKIIREHRMMPDTGYGELLRTWHDRKK